MITFARAVQLHQLIRQVATIFTMVALAHVGLQLDEIGNFESLRYLGFVLTGFWINGLSNAYLRIRQTTEHHERWYVYYLLVVLLGGLIVFSLFATSTSFLGNQLLDSPNLQDGLAFGVFMLGSIAGAVVEQEAIADKARIRLLAYSFSSYGLQVFLFLVPLILGYPIAVAIWGLAFSAIYRLIWVSVRYFRVTDVKLPLKQELQKFWNSASGLSIYGMSAAVVLAIDHALVGYFSEEPKRAMAIWRYGAQELPLLVGIVSGLNSTALAEMQDGAAIMLSQLKRRSQNLNRIFIPLAIVLCISSQWWFPMIFSQDFYAAHIIFNTMLLIVPSRLVLTTPLMISKDMQGSMTKVGILENMINIVVSLLLVTQLGLLGIAIGTVIAYNFERICHVYLLSKEGNRTSAYLADREWIILTLVLFICYGFFTNFNAVLPG